VLPHPSVQPFIPFFMHCACTPFHILLTCRVLDTDLVAFCLLLAVVLKVRHDMLTYGPWVWLWLWLGERGKRKEKHGIGIFAWQKAQRDCRPAGKCRMRLRFFLQQQQQQQDCMGYHDMMFMVRAIVPLPTPRPKQGLPVSSLVASHLHPSFLAIDLPPPSLLLPSFFSFLSLFLSATLIVSSFPHCQSLLFSFCNLSRSLPPSFSPSLPFSLSHTLSLFSLFLSLNSFRPSSPDKRINFVTISNPTSHPITLFPLWVASNIPFSIHKRHTPFLL